MRHIEPPSPLFSPGTSFSEWPVPGAGDDITDAVTTPCDRDLLAIDAGEQWISDGCRTSCHAVGFYI
jgi:hypothetical protein